MREDAKRSGGVFGSAELALMESDDDMEAEKEIAKFVNRYRARSSESQIPSHPEEGGQLKADEDDAARQQQQQQRVLEQKKIELLGKYLDL